MEHWRIELFGGLRLVRGERTIRRFRSQKTAGLLAYLACYSSRDHPRDELVDRFWPENELEAGRHTLRQALTSLRRQLEPPGITPGGVLLTGRRYARLNPAAITTDLVDFD